MHSRFLFLIVFLLCSIFLLQPVFAQQTITVTGTVAPKVTDFELSATSDEQKAVSQNTTLSYEISYGSLASAGVPTETLITVHFMGGIAPDGNSVISYLQNSATPAYGNSKPVLNPLQRTLSWTIPNLPAATTESVSFKLQTTDNYTGSASVPFGIKVQMSNQYFTLPEVELGGQNYTYILTSQAATNQQQSALPTITPTPSQSSTTSDAPLAVSINRITQENVTVSVITNPNTRLTLRYGTSVNNLTNSVTITGQQTNQTVSIASLRPETTYYFQVVTPNQTSDIYTFTTARTSTPPTGENNVVIITSNGSVLLSDVKEKDTPASAVALVTTDTPYEITYRVRNKTNLTAIDAVMRQMTSSSQKPVLAANELVIAMREKEPSVYVAQLKTDIAGSFDIFVRMQDSFGNVIEEKIAATKIIPLLLVLDKDSGEPIPDARVNFFYFNQQTKKHEHISPLAYEKIDNPSYTKINGTVKVLLPPGKYKVEVNAFGYDKKEVTFVLGSNPGEDFPQIGLTKNPKNLFNYISYYTTALMDFGTKVQAAIAGLAFSIRFFNLLAGFILGIAILMTFLFFHLRTHVGIKTIIPYFIHHFQRLFKKNMLSSFCATITDQDGKKITQAHVETIDEATGAVVTSFISNKNGVCYILNPAQKNKMKLLITKEGFTPKTVAVDSDISISKDGVTIVMEKGVKPSHTIEKKIMKVVEKIGGMFFELSLLLSLLLELLFFSLFGFAKTLPFFILSIFNLLLWIFYQQEKQARKVFKKP